MLSRTKLRNKINGVIYKSLIKPICFRFDPEKVHNLFIRRGVFLASHETTKKIISSAYYYCDKSLEQDILGMKIKNPVGLAAGFDKNGELVNILGKIGFGFAEIGSVTDRRCAGNPGIRLSRLPEKKSLWVHLGLNNEGAMAIYERLKKSKRDIPIGVSIAKTNCIETADNKIGISDYCSSFKIFSKIADYIVLNISCPNAYGGEPFTNPELYDSLLSKVDKLQCEKPIFVKISPDLSKEVLNKIIEISGHHRVHGFICSNLTKKHNLGKGGLSGMAVKEKSDFLISYIYRKTFGKYIIIGTGGIFSAEDAYKKIRLGANLVQLITGMIYQGPNLISEINEGLVQLLRKDGYRSISEAVGSANYSDKNKN